MNIDLDARQHALVAAVRAQLAQLPAQAPGWAALDRLNLSELLANGSGRVFGQVEWCLVFEELGTGVHDLAAVGNVRTFVDVFFDEDGAQEPRRVLRLWGEAWREWHSLGDGLRVATPAPELLIGGCGTFQYNGPASVRPAALRTNQIQDVADRVLLAHAAYCLGIGRRALETAQDRAADRKVGGRRLLEQQSTAHRLARAALALACARLEVWEAAWWEDTHGPCGYRAPAAAASALTAVLDCAHETVQVFGAAGTSYPEPTRLYQAAYGAVATYGSPSELQRAAGARSFFADADNRAHRPSCEDCDHR